MASKRAAAKRNPEYPNATWRRREIVLPEPLVERLFEWHGGQDTAIYALASIGMRNLVSLSMIDAAMAELERDARARLTLQDKKSLKHVIAGLSEVRQYWKEHSHRDSGAALEESEYEMDVADYGLDPEDEAAIETHTG